ncbi:glycosyltransferase [Actinomarinicola tropica]|nr:glycosyltransferase [Actinomarinicola tropica]
MIHFLGPVPPLRGGIAQHSDRLLDALVDAGHHVTVDAWSHQYPRRLYPGDEVDPSAVPRPSARFTLRWWDPSSWVRAGRAARTADLVLIPWVTPVQAVAYLTALRAASGTPAVGIIHNPLPHERRPFDRVLTRSMLRRLTGAVTHARTVSEEVGKLAPGLALREVPHPPNLDVEEAPLPDGPPWRLLFLGFIRPYKGLDTALDAMVELRRRRDDVTLTIAGQVWGSPDPWYRAIHERGLDDVVDFRPGYVPNSRLGLLLAEHHLVVAPYRSATQSGIVPLAQAAGRGVIATDVGGLSEALTDGVDGYLTPPGDVPAFAAAIERALPRVQELADAARSASSSWRDVAEAVLAVGSPTSDR